MLRRLRCGAERRALRSAHGLTCLRTVGREGGRGRGEPRREGEEMRRARRTRRRSSSLSPPWPLLRHRLREPAPTTTDRRRTGRAAGGPSGRDAEAAREGRRGDDRPPGQLHAPVLAALPGDVRRPARLHEGGRRGGVQRRPRTSRRRCPTPTNGGKTWVVQDPQGDQVLERQGGDARRRGRLAPAHLQGQAAPRPAGSTPASSARTHA